MSILLFIAYVVLIPFLIGTAINRFLYPGTICNGRALLSGHVVMFAVFEILHCVSLKNDWKLPQVANFYTAICIVLVLISLALTVRVLPRVTSSIYAKAKISLPAVLTIGLLAIALLNYRLFLPDIREYSNHETVNTILSTEYIYEHNMLTGKFLVLGIRPIHKFMSYPVFVAVLIRTTGLPITLATQVLLPFAFLVFALVGASVAYPMLHRMLGCDGENAPKARFFVPVYLALLMLFSTVEGTAGYGLLRQGLLGNPLLATLFLPFVLSFLTEKRKWWMKLAALLFTGAAAVSVTDLSILSDMFVSETGIGCAHAYAAWVILLLYDLLRVRKAGRGRMLKVFVILGLLSLSGNWVLPVAYVLYTECGLLVGRMSNRTKRYVLPILGLLFLSVGSVFFFSSTGAVRREKLSDEFRVIAYLDEVNEEEYVVVGPRAVMKWARVESGKAILPYGRDFWEGKCNRVIPQPYTTQDFSLYVRFLSMENSQIMRDATNQVVVSPSQRSLLEEIAMKAPDCEAEYVVTTLPMPEEYGTLLTEIGGYYIYNVLQ